MSKSKKELLRQLLELEDDDLGEDRLPEEPQKTPQIEQTDTINAVPEEEPLTKPKKQLTAKQLEALKKGQQKRDENRVKNKTEKEKREAEEKRILEEKLVKKAIALKKKQIKKQALLDEISDDETPIEKIKQIVVTAKEPEKPKGPVFRFF
jgi:hypothetical protein